MRSALRAATSSSGNAALMNCSIVGTCRAGAAGGIARGCAEARARKATKTASVRCMFFIGVLLLNPGDTCDDDRRQQALLRHGGLTFVVGRLLLDLAGNVQALHNAAERRATLAVFESL